MDELKPCPFCGNKYVCLEERNSLHGDLEGYFIFCINCGIETGLYSNADKLIRKWNRRADDGRH